MKFFVVLGVVFLLWSYEVGDPVSLEAGGRHYTPDRGLVCRGGACVWSGGGPMAGVSSYYPPNDGGYGRPHHHYRSGGGGGGEAALGAAVGGFLGAVIGGIFRPTPPPQVVVPPPVAPVVQAPIAPTPPPESRISCGVPHCVFVAGGNADAVYAVKAAFNRKSGYRVVGNLEGANFEAKVRLEVRGDPWALVFVEITDLESGVVVVSDGREHFKPKDTLSKSDAIIMAGRQAVEGIK